MNLTMNPPLDRLWGSSLSSSSFHFAFVAWLVAVTAARSAGRDQQARNQQAKDVTF